MGQTLVFKQPLTDSSSGGEATGTIQGPYVYWTNGSTVTPYAAVHFNGGTGNGGGNYVGTADPGLFNFTTNSFTINVWFLPYSYDAYLAGNNSYDACGWFLCLSGDHIEFGADNNGSESVLQTVNTIGGWPWNQATNNYTYNMVTITRDGTNTPAIYLNGLATATAMITQGGFVNPASSTNSLTFGSGTNLNGFIQYDGNMWQPQIWSAALSASEIANLYFNQLSRKHWP